MGKLRNYLSGLLVLTLLFSSCSKDDEANGITETVALSFGAELNDLVNKAATKQALEGLPDCSEEDPAYVRIVLSSDGTEIVGTEEAPFRIDLSDGQLFTEEVPELQLVPGAYSLDYFAVYSADDELLWVAPRNGVLANFVDDPLPLAIQLGAGTKKYVDVPVVCFDDRFVNEYGYLFFDIETGEAHEFCVFGNYCDEAGRHFPAHFEVNIWHYSDGERGALIVSEENEVSEDENGDFAGSTVCVALPDTDGLDEYYIEITLLDSEAYGDVENGVIREGVFNDDTVRDLFVGEDGVDFYHFREGNCGLSDAPDIFDEGAGPCDLENPDADCDNDDVPNGDDDCPDTPVGTPVDDRGCELTGCDALDMSADCDNDGVNNGDDDCPDSAEGAVVDANGCATCDTADPNADCDGDGVTNGNDDCPDTDAGVTVDEDGCEAISVPGRDIVVFNDINLLDNDAMQDPDNIRLVQNLVNFTTTGSRNSGTTFMIDTGRSYCSSYGGCDIYLGTFFDVVAGEGFSVSEIESTEGSLTSIPSDVKILMLTVPAVQYTVNEINTFKSFAADGGRIIFMGEHQGAYPGISIENQFLLNMGAVLHNTGGAVDCQTQAGEYFPAQPSPGVVHPIMVGVNELSIACASVIEPGPDDFPLFYDTTGTLVLGGVAKIDTTPISALRSQHIRVAAPGKFVADPTRR